MSQSNKIILLDSDVISHFIANNCLADLPTILAPHQCMVVDYVYAEIARNPFRKAILDGIIASGAIQQMHFPNDDLAIKLEFAQIKKRNYLIGDGERACMAIAANRDVFDEAKCDSFIQNAMTYNKARFPNGITQIRHYTPPDLSFV